MYASFIKKYILGGGGGISSKVIQQFPNSKLKILRHGFVGSWKFFAVKPKSFYDSVTCI
jgi:hypothetical protein